MNSEITGYIEKQKFPQKNICNKLRKIILKTLPKINETIKMGVPWYEGKYYIVSLKDSVNLGFSVKGLSKQELALFKGTGKIMRHQKFKDIKDIDEKQIIQLLKLVNKKAQCGSCWK